MQARNVKNEPVIFLPPRLYSEKISHTFAAENLRGNDLSSFQ